MATNLAIPYRGLSELTYPLHDWTTRVTYCGRLCYRRREINLSQAFAGQMVGVKQVDEHIWLVVSWTTISATLMIRPVGSNRSRIRLARKCYLCLQNNL